MKEVLTLARAEKLYFQGVRTPLIDFLTTFFPTVRTYDTREIPIDQIVPRTELAKYRERNAGSNVVKFNSGKGAVYDPEVVDEITPIDEWLADSIAAGEDVTTPAATRMANRLRDILADHEDRLIRVQVKQAMDLLISDKFQPMTKGAKGVGDFISFGRKTGNTISAAYGGGTPTPLEQWKDGIKQYASNNGAPVSRIVTIVGSDILNRLEADAGFTKAIQTEYFGGRNFYTNNENRVLTPLYQLKIPGTSYRSDLVAFSGGYTDDTGAWVDFMPAKGMLILSLDSPRVRAYGGIYRVDNNSESANIVAGEMVSDKLVSKNPDILGIRSQSRPLLVPGIADHVVYIASTN